MQKDLGEDQFKKINFLASIKMTPSMKTAVFKLASDPVSGKE